jgi:hypothetical protein
MENVDPFRKTFIFLKVREGKKEYSIFPIPFSFLAPVE